MFCRLFLVGLLAAGIPLAPALAYDDAGKVLGTALAHLSAPGHDARTIPAPTSHASR